MPTTKREVSHRSIRLWCRSDPDCNQALLHYRAHAAVLVSVRDALVGQACMDHRLWDAEMVPVMVSPR